MRCHARRRDDDAIAVRLQTRHECRGLRRGTMRGQNSRGIGHAIAVQHGKRLLHHRKIAVAAHQNRYLLRHIYPPKTDFVFQRKKDIPLPCNRNIGVQSCPDTPGDHRYRNAQKSAVTEYGMPRRTAAGFCASHGPTKLSASRSSLPQTFRPFSVSHGEYTYIIPDFRFFVKRYRVRIFLPTEGGLCRIFTRCPVLRI